MMTRYIFPALLLLGSISISEAKTFNIKDQNVTYSYPAEMVGIMDFGSNKTLTVLEKEFTLSDTYQIWVDESAVEKNIVEVSYTEVGAEVRIAGDIANYITATVEGANVVITQSDDVSADNCGEITYRLSGSSSDGSFYLSGSFKSTVELAGLSLTSSTGAPIDIQNGKRINLRLADESLNTLVDATDGKQKGCIVCKGHLEIKGEGKLTVEGNASHAIYAKEYIELSKADVEITKSAKDGINCNQYFMMKSGTLNITGVGDDGIQVSYKDETDREAEDTGALTINGGTIKINVTNDASKGLKCEGIMTISDGVIDITVSGNGIYDEAKLKTKASACLGSDEDLVISGGTLDLKATGSGGKGISCDGVFTCNGGKVNIATTGGMLVYSNGSLNHNYTSSADRINSDNKSSAKGIKADSGVIINDGELYITTATNNAEGIESKKELDINGGKIFVKAYDDGINSSNDFRVSGGDLTVISIVGDGLDSNGNLTISGGYIRTMGSGGMEMGLDAATESGCAVYITGGTVMSFGGSNTYPTKTGSTQAFVNTSGSIKADAEVILKSGDEVLATFTVPAEYNTTAATINRGPGNGPGGGGWQPGGNSGNGSLMISCPQLISGQSYTLVNDDASSTVTATLTGSGR